MHWKDFGYQGTGSIFFLILQRSLRTYCFKPKDFLLLSQAEITAHKWKMLLERWTIILKATLSTSFEDSEMQTTTYLRIIQIN